MSDYIAIISFPTQALTYEAFTKMRNTSGGLGLQAATIVERDQAGVTSLAEGEDEWLGAGTIGGSVVGMLVGAIAGPVGMLLGWGAGVATGAVVDIARTEQGGDVLTQYAAQVAPGTNAILAQTSEADTSALDALVAAMGGTIVRHELGEVLAELDAQQEAAEEAAQAARKAIHEQKVAERTQSHEEHVAALKAQLAGAKKARDDYFASIRAKFTSES